MEDTKLIYVSNSNEKKTIINKIKEIYEISNPTFLNYVVLDLHNIIVFNKTYLNKEKELLKKTITIIKESWEKIYEEKSGLFIIEKDSKFYVISLIKGVFNLEVEDIDLELASLLSIVETFRNKNIKIFYEDIEELNSLFEDLSSMLDIDINFFNKKDLSDIDNLEINSFSESSLINIYEKMKNKKSKNKEIEEKNNKDNKFKKKKIFGIIFIFTLIIVSGLYSYFQYEAEKKLEAEKIEKLKNLKHKKNSINYKKVEHIRTNEILFNEIKNEIFNKDKDILKIIYKNNLLTFFEFNKNNNLNDFSKITQIKIGNKYFTKFSKKINSNKTPSKSEISFYLNKSKEDKEIFNKLRKNANNFNYGKTIKLISKDYKTRKEFLSDLKEINYLNKKIDLIFIFFSKENISFYLKYK